MMSFVMTLRYRETYFVEEIVKEWKEEGLGDSRLREINLLPCRIS